jgi:hypothetical protein
MLAPLIVALAPNYIVYPFCIKTKDVALAYIKGPCTYPSGPLSDSWSLQMALAPLLVALAPRKMSLFGCLSGIREVSYKSSKNQILFRCSALKVDCLHD